MLYSKIWDKTLAEGERVVTEFSVGDLYRIYLFIVYCFFSLIFLFLRKPLIALSILLLGVFYSFFYLKVARAYAFTTKRVLIYRGWLSTKLTSVNYEKITDISVHEPFFDRLISQTGSLMINTAGSSETELILKHVERPYELKKQLDKIRDAQGVPTGSALSFSPPSARSPYS